MYGISLKIIIGEHREKSFTPKIQKLQLFFKKELESSKQTKSLVLYEI